MPRVLRLVVLGLAAYAYLVSAQEEPLVTTINPNLPTTTQPTQNPAVTTVNPSLTTVNPRLPTTMPAKTTLVPGLPVVNTTVKSNTTKTSAAAAAAAAGAAATAAPLPVDTSLVDVGARSEYGTKSPLTFSNSSGNSTTSTGGTASSLGSWLVPVVIGAVVIGALVFASVLKKQNNDDNERDLGGHRRATSYFEHPRTHKQHVPKYEESGDVTPVLGQSNLQRSQSNHSQIQTQRQGPGPLHRVGSNSNTQVQAPNNGDFPMKKQSSTMLTTSMSNDRPSDEVPPMLEASLNSFPSLMSPQSSAGSSFQTPEPGTSVIL